MHAMNTYRSGGVVYRHWWEVHVLFGFSSTCSVTRGHWTRQEIKRDWANTDEILDNLCMSLNVTAVIK